MSDQSFFRVRMKSFVSNWQMNFDLYVKINGQIITYLRAGDRISKEKLDALIARDSGDHFFIEMKSRDLYHQFIRDQIRSSDHSITQKSLILKESSLSIAEDLFENPNIAVAMDKSRPLIQDFLYLMDQAPESLSMMISLSSHDFYTYNHSLDVSLYAIGLAKSLGMSGAELEELGVGSLFHDIGKRQVSLDILCKRGPLNDVEWSSMQMHPQYGLLILNDIPGVSDAVKASAYEHHEAFSGIGYPQGISGEEIHPFARIIALTDTFDAMTTQRSYNVPMKPSDALTMMKEKLAGKYDPQMLNAMYSVLFQLKSAA